MSTIRRLGISVYTELGRTGGPPPPKNWWDLDGILKLGLDVNEKDLPTYFKKVLSLRIPKGEQDIEKQLRELAKGKSLQDVFFESVFLDLSAANVHGNILQCQKSVGKVAKLTDLTIGGSYANAITGAMECTDAGCEAYQKAILELLRDRADVRVNAYKTPGAKLQEYGQVVMPEKVKFYTRLRRSDSRPQIEVLFASEKYKNPSSHARHVEILSGVLFEAGNVYCGNYDPPSQRKETEVFAHNTRQVIGIARNHPITQTDWRNMMTLLLTTDINITTFKCTALAIRAFTVSAHDISSKMKVDYE